MLIGSTTVSIAQPVLTDPGCNPVPGENFTIIISPSVSPGNSGANQNWNLSSMSFSSSGNVTISIAATTPSSGLYPGANVGYKDGYYNQFFKTSSVSLQSYGNFYYADVNQGTVVTTYTDPVDYLHLPCNYNDTYTDAFSGSKYTTTSITPNFIHFGTTTVTADGYGTLAVPTKSYSSVMRVHLNSRKRDSISGNSFGSYYNADEYLWFTPGVHYPVAGIISYGGNMSGFYISNYSVAGIKEISNTLKNVQLYPIPASEFLHISVPPEASNELELNVINSLGQVLKSKSVIAESSQVSLKVTDLAEGIYTIKIRDVKNNLSVNKQIIISK
jgi:hypothetical protein